MKKIRSFFSGIIYENPLFISSLGMCSALAVTLTFENSLMMGLSVLVVLIGSNFIIALLKGLIAEEIRIPAYIVIIATFVTLVEILLRTYVPNIYEALGIYLPLIVVNCIILGRALAFASKNKVLASINDGVKMGLGFTLALIILGTIREVLGSNQITIMDKTAAVTGYIAKYQIFPDNNMIPNQLFLSPGGAFITLGLIIAVIKVLRNRGEKHESS